MERDDQLIKTILEDIYTALGRLAVRSYDNQGDVNTIAKGVTEILYIIYCS